MESTGNTQSSMSIDPFLAHIQKMSTFLAEFLGHEYQNVKKITKSWVFAGFQNVCTKIFQNDSSFKKKIFKNF